MTVCVFTQFQILNRREKLGRWIFVKQDEKQRWGHFPKILFENMLATEALIVKRGQNSTQWSEANSSHIKL